MTSTQRIATKQHIKFVALALLSLFFLFLTPAATPQQIYDPPRPVLDFRCPTYSLAGDRPIPMYAEIIGARDLLNGERAKRIVFKWTLSGGRLLSGQRTGKVLVDATELQTDGVGCIDVKLEVEGAPPELEREKTCTLRIDPKCTAPQLFDQYGGVSATEERQHLDRLAEYLKNAGPESIAYIITYTGRRACIYEAAWRGDRAKKYLIEKYHVPGERIITVDGGVRENRNEELFIQTHGTCGPLPSPTLARDEAHARGQCKDVYNEFESR